MSNALPFKHVGIQLVDAQAPLQPLMVSLRIGARLTSISSNQVGAMLNSLVAKDLAVELGVVTWYLTSMSVEADLSSQ